MGEKGCGDVQLLHTEMLERHEQDNKELKAANTEILQRITSLELRVSELCNNVAELIKEVKNNYQQKAVCEMCQLAYNKENADLRHKCDNLQTDLNTFKTWLISLLITNGIAIFMGVIGFILTRK